jgi:hypothetical protein
LAFTFWFYYENFVKQFFFFFNIWLAFLLEFVFSLFFIFD